jgi:hypothetical protein
MQRPARWLVLALALVLSGALAGGCGGGPGKPIKVSGKVKWADGNPVVGATVSFMPTREGGREANGFTGEDGSFDLTTFNSGDGALPGDYKVLVTRPKTTEAPQFGEVAAESNPTEKMKKFFYESKRKGSSGGAKDAIPNVYSSVTTTPLRWTVESGNTTPELKIQKGK